MSYRLTTARHLSFSRSVLSSTTRIFTTKPCSDYLNTTHPDGDASPSSKIATTLNRFSNSVLATYSRPQLLFTRGSGLDLYSAADPSKNSGHAERKYLDFSSGIAVNSLGHADDKIAKLAGEQSSRLVHASNMYHNEWSGELADRMVKLTHQHGGLGFEKASQPKEAGLKVFLANSGTEANEAALKFARKAAKDTKSQDKTQLVCFHNAFHGRTMGALSVTPNPKYQAPFAPLIGDVVVGEYNDHANLSTLITSKTAGVIVEPVQGEGGIFSAHTEWLQALRMRCDEVGALLIFDEIQCGLFRSGTMWCHSDFPTDAHPDMVTMAKPLANGFPIGAVLMRDRVAQMIAVGDHGTTFGGGPLTSRIAHHVLGRLSDPDLGSLMKEAHQALMSRLEGVADMFQDLILNEPEKGKPSPRGKGLLLGMSMRNPAHAGKIVALARQRGLLILTAGSDTVRIIPSLIVSKEQINTAVDIIESCMLVLREELKSSFSSGSMGGKRAYSTSACPTLLQEFMELGESWPKDPLRSHLDFGKAIQSAAQTGLQKELTSAEVEFARKGLEALRALKNGDVSKQYPTPDSILKPASAPKYYERLLSTLERAGQGKSVGLSFGDKLKRFFGRS